MNNKPYLIQFPKIGNSNLGYISIAEGVKLPFTPKRIYWTYYTPQEVKRGAHAHLELNQIMIAVAGIITIELEMPNKETYKFTLDAPNIGVFIPKLCWHTMQYTHNAVQMCIASSEYNEADYIRDYEKFKKL